MRQLKLHNQLVQEELTQGGELHILYNPGITVEPPDKQRPLNPGTGFSHIVEGDGRQLRVALRFRFNFLSESDVDIIALSLTLEFCVPA